MKVSLASDVHLEFGDLELKNNDGADVLILSGDICVAKYFNNLLNGGMKDTGLAYRFKDFFQRCSDEFPVTLMVMGNHEHYDGDFAKSADLIKEAIVDIKNVHLLDKETMEVGGVMFAGATLWTDMNNHDEQTLYHVGRSMNDFRIVENSNRLVHHKVPIFLKDGEGQYVRDDKGNVIQVREEFRTRTSVFSTEDAYEDHQRTIDFLSRAYSGMKEDQKMVVLTHHAPSKLSTHPRYKHEVLMNGGYSSDLTEFITARPQIKLWTHGHTHEDFDYVVGDTRIVCNPRGYINYESRADGWNLKTFEV
jgi:Icc-related predicted phosphoesterase